MIKNNQRYIAILLLKRAVNTGNRDHFSCTSPVCLLVSVSVDQISAALTREKIPDTRNGTANQNWKRNPPSNGQTTIAIPNIIPNIP